ncbi:hypothetical protein [Altererythrobacter sp. ZODW24]|uniref:hypothetical protein n=1 Tax=Altererythrobacter sp. ZODW24 TaxID=2185142 RepID=UPI000DF81161|nr:hypothetical protein [Altererythrobacter sp. ZODW24]
MARLLERRRASMPPELLARVGLAWALVCVLLLLTNFAEISARRFPGPDDVLRLVQLRDLLGGQSWFDVTQYRIDAANGGVAMHWSRLVDIPLLAVIGLLTPVFGQHAAEGIALVMVPLVTFGLALLLVGRMVWRLVGGEAAGLACLAMALSVPVVTQLRPMRIDHHGWQIVAALLAVNGMMSRSPKLGGWATGFALALWLSISVEGLPLAVAICGLAALRWWRDRADRLWLVSILQSLAVSSAALFAATRGISDLATYCDAIAPVHLAIFAWSAVSVTALAAMEPRPRAIIVGGFALMGAGALGIVFNSAPQCAGGGFGEMDPVVSTYWLDLVAEGLPVWRQPFATILQTIIPPVIGILAAIQLAGKSSDWLRRWWTDYAILLVAALVLAIFVTRAGAVAGALAAVPLGWQITQWIRAARNMRQSGKRVLALAGVAVALLPAMPLTLFTLAIPAKAANEGEVVKANSCDIPGAAQALAKLPAGEIFAPLDIGPQLLLETKHTVAATGHHRGQNGIRAVIETFTGTSEEARETLAVRGSAYVALCPALFESRYYESLSEDGFAAQLRAGDTPEWLTPIATPQGSDFKIWRIKR